MQQSVPIHIAVDLGASSGRVLAVGFGEQAISVDVMHRFKNGSLQIGQGLFWDHLNLWSEIVQGIRACSHRYQDNLRSIGVDTWGVDYLLLDKKQTPIGPGYCYRDDRCIGMMERAFERLPKAEIFAETGIQFMQINTLYQLLAYQLQQPQLLDCADKFLMVPDFLHWMLSGQVTSEVTNASTTQILRAADQQWSSKICQAMHFKTSWFESVTQPGTTLGQLRHAVCELAQIHPIEVVCPASHDTASAVLAVPVAEFANEKPSWGYISSGTWSLMGVELAEPILDERCLAANFTNEAGPNGSIRLLKNIAGLWPLQQVLEEVLRRGQSLTWSELMQMIDDAPPLRALINLDDSRLINPDNMTLMVTELLRETGQSVPEQIGGLARILLESLALRYRTCLQTLEELLGYQLDTLYIIGGGVQNELLCQMTADATDRMVVTGHAESTAVGNAMMQSIGTGHFSSIFEARSYLAKTTRPKTYQPLNTDRWDEATSRLKRSPS